jgi:hypothetical protein
MKYLNLPSSDWVKKSISLCIVNYEGISEKIDRHQREFSERKITLINNYVIILN